MQHKDRSQTNLTVHTKVLTLVCPKQLLPYALAPFVNYDYILYSICLLPETFVATVTLDGKDYDPATYGNPNSEEYKQMKEDFCNKVGVYSQY